MLTVILKGTNGCNLNCAYCSLGEKTNMEMISSEKLTEVLDYIYRVCQSRGEDKVNIILHGGEPTLVPTSLYEESLHLVKEKYANIELRIMMQTNAYHLSDDMVSFLVRNHVAVGVSIDGAEMVHDSERKSKSDQATFQKVQKNIERMLSQGLSVSCLMVLTSIGLSAGYDFVHYFAKNNIPLKINPLLDYGEVYKNPELSIHQGDYARYLIGLYEYIVENDIDVQIDPLEKYVQARLENHSIRECTYNRECNKNFLCIDHLGDIYPCGKFSDIHSFCLGNVASASLDIVNSDIMKRLYDRRNITIPKECMDCKFRERCGSGCTAEAAIEGDIMKIPKMCRDYKMLFQYFEKEGLLFLREHLKKKKEELMAGLKNGL